MTDAHGEELAGDSTPLAVVDEYETLPGASGARCVLAENGAEYLIKGPSLVEGHPTVGGNEWIAARLADAVGLPVLDHRILTMGSNLFFASAYMGKGTFAPAITADLFKKCENRDRVYGIVVFDAWLINRDRHNQNLIVRRPKKSAERRLLLLNDHSHLLVSPSGPTQINRLMDRVDDPPGNFVSLHFIRQAITDAAQLTEALDRVETLSEKTIRAAIASTPAELLSISDQAIYADFLIKRRSRLRGLMQNGAHQFPNLKGSI